MSIFVVPKKGLKIVDPQLRDQIPDEGREVQDSTYWRRMANYGDVSIIDPASVPVVAQVIAEKPAK